MLGQWKPLTLWHNTFKRPIAAFPLPLDLRKNRNTTIKKLVMLTPKLRKICAFSYISSHLQFEIAHIFFFSSDSKLGRAGFRLLATQRRIHPTPGVASCSCTLLDHSAVLQWFKVINRSIKVTKKTFFHPRVLYFWSFTNRGLVFT